MSSTTPAAAKPTRSEILDKLLDYYNSRIPESNFKLLRPRYYVLKDEAREQHKDEYEKQQEEEGTDGTLLKLVDPSLTTNKFAKPKASAQSFSRSDLADLGIAENQPRLFASADAKIAASIGGNDDDTATGAAPVEQKIQYRRAFLSAFMTKCFQYSGYLGLGAASVASCFAYYKTRTLLVNQLPFAMNDSNNAFFVKK